MVEYPLLTYRSLQRRLVRTQVKELLSRLLWAEAKAGIVAVGILLGIVSVEAVFFATSSVRQLLWYGWLGATGALIVGAALPTVARLLGVLPREPLDKLALRIGRYYPHIGDMLCNVLQLVNRLEQQRGTSAELALAAFAQVAQRAQEIDFDVILDRRRTWRSVLLFFGIVGISSLIGGVAPLRSAFHRLVMWERSFLPPPPFQLRVEPLKAVVVRGTPVTIQVRAEGIPPTVVRLVLLPAEGERQLRELSAQTPGNFVADIGRVMSSLRFYAVADWMGYEVRSPEGSIRVVDPLLIRSLSCEIRPPAYTRLEPMRLNEQGGEVAVPRGSVAWVTVEANRALQSAEILFARPEDTLRSPLRVSGRLAQGSFPIATSGAWTVVLQDSEGQRNTNPLWYRLTVLEDAPPQISFIQPTSDVELSEQQILPIRVAVSDDYGFSRLLLHYRLASSRYVASQKEFRTLSIPFLPSLPVQEVPYVWDLSPLKPSPEDRYEFFVEVWDNDAMTGPKSARTPILSATLPSLEQVLRQSEGVQQRIAEELQESVRQFDQLRQRSEELRRQLSMPSARQPQARWEQQRRLEELLQQHQQVQERMERLQQQLEDIAERLERAQAISPETLQKYRELQQLLQQVRSPELQRLMEQLQNALRQMSPEQMRQALQQFRFNEAEFRAVLERTLRLLKRLQAEQKLEALRRQLEALAEQQEQLHQQTERAQAPEQLSELARRQEAIRAEWQRIQQEWQETERLLQDVLPETPPEALQAAAEQLNDAQASEMLQQAERELQRGQRMSAQQAQRRAASRMRSAAAALQRLWDELQRNLTREIQRQLQKAMVDALELSEQQEKLLQRTQSVPAGSQRLIELARRQEELRSAASAVTERVMGVAQKSFAVTPQMARELGTALRAMQQARTQLSERSPTSAAQAQQEAMEALNRSVLLLQDALSALQAATSGACPNPGSGQGAGAMGFLERLQQLALQQQGITQALQQLSQGRLTMEQQAQLARLAAQQAQVQQALEELARQQQALEGRKLLGDLRRLSEEMREVVQELQSGTVTEETVRRQHRILSRMLDALRSLYERDYEPQRESRPGQNLVRPSPPGLRLPEQQPALVPEQIMPALQQGYSRDYRRLIERYFDQLRRQGVSNANW